MLVSTWLILVANYMMSAQCLAKASMDINKMITMPAGTDPPGS